MTAWNEKTYIMRHRYKNYKKKLVKEKLAILKDLTKWK